MTVHVADELELYALGALTDDEAGRVADHLAACAACRTAAASLMDIVSALPETVAPREPSAGLRERILRSARATAGAPRAARPFPLRLYRSRFVTAGLAAAVIVLAAVSLDGRARLRDAEADTREIVERVSTSARTWYMSGTGAFEGSGGTLIAPQRGPAFVLFHDLKPIEPGTRYTLWLVSPEGRWLRTVSFRPDGGTFQTVDLATNVAGYDRCLLVLDSGAATPAEAPVVMQSRIAPPSS